MKVKNKIRVGSNAGLEKEKKQNHLYLIVLTFSFKENTRTILDQREENEAFVENVETKDLLLDRSHMQGGKQHF